MTAPTERRSHILLFDVPGVPESYGLCRECGRLFNLEAWAGTWCWGRPSVLDCPRCGEYYEPNAHETCPYCPVEDDGK